MVLPYIILFVVSLAVLVKASDWFVEAAEDIGLSLGVSPFIIGVTIIAFGTSLPELAASIAAMLSDNSEIVLGNVVGSNITNILLVLGLTAIISGSINMDFDVMDIDMPLLISSAFMFWFIVYDGSISIFEALLLLAGMVIFLLNSIRARREPNLEKHQALRKNYFLLPASAALVYLGATYTITAIEVISEAMNIPTEIIALTAVALGTSLPEVVVSITAAMKGKSAIAVGNVLGSNAFNTFAVVGIPALIGDVAVPQNILDFGTPFMIGITALFAFVCLSKRISNWEGWMLMVLYVFYLYKTIV